MDKFHLEDIALVESLDENTRKRLAFIIERIRRRSYTPEDVRMRLVGLKVPTSINRNGVNAFHEEGIAFDRRRGWHKKGE
jgi:hypothetical protein